MLKKLVHFQPLYVFHVSIDRKQLDNKNLAFEGSGTIFYCCFVLKFNGRM